VAAPRRAPPDAAPSRRLREEVLGSEPLAVLPPGAVAEMLDGGRLTALAGDLAADGETPVREGGPWPDTDTVLHCAATVSFEEPLDLAMELNSFGPRRLLERLRAAGSDPHFVHVSTAYVADRSRAEIGEDDPPHPALAALDPEQLLAEARAAREEAERESRSEPLSGRFAAAAGRDAARREGLDAG